MSERSHSIHAWLAQVLGREDFALAPASADASFRHYLRVTVGGDSWVLMDAPPQQEDCEPFVRIATLLARAGVRVPAVHAADLAQGFLLLDDLGTELYLAHLDEHSADRLYEDALRALVCMQRHAPVDTLPRYDANRLRAEMALFSDWLLNRHLGAPASGAESATLASAFDFLIAEATAQPQVFVHRDYHSRNLLLLPVDNPGVIDFQDALRGPATYDLVSLLRDAYVAWPERRVRGWVARYRELALEAGLEGVRDEPGLSRDFDLMGVQRHIKVAGIFARLFHRDGKAGYLADIPLVLDYLCRVAARYPELSGLVALCEARNLGAAVVAANERLLAAAGVTAR